MGSEEADSRLIGSLLYGVSTFDPATYGIAMLAVLACALLAGLVPAIRASRVDPLVALRTDWPRAETKPPGRCRWEKPNPSDIMNLRRFASIFTVAVAAVVASPTVFAQPTPVDPNAPRILTVNGQETVRIPATLARLSIIIEAREKTSAEASRAVVGPSTKVLEFLKDQGADRIQAGALTLNPIYSRAKVSSMASEEPDITGYLAQWNATFDVPAERAGEFTAGVIKAGANRVTHFEFRAADAAIEVARREALQAATRKARATAEAVLETLDYKVREIVRINVNSSGPVMPFQRGMLRASAMKMVDASGGASAVEPGFIDIEGNVGLEVRY